MIDFFYCLLSSGTLGAIVARLLNMRTEKRTKAHIENTALTAFNDTEKYAEGLRKLLYLNIEQIYEKSSLVGYCASHSLREAEELYTLYKHLGGNGMCETLIRRIRKMPTREEYNRGIIRQTEEGNEK
jgi:hypothetical protein